MPNAVAMIGITLPPGRSRNLSLGFFGASAPMAGGVGSLFAGAVILSIGWKWVFFITYVVWPGLELKLYMCILTEFQSDPLPSRIRDPVVHLTPRNACRSKGQDRLGWCRVGYVWIDRV